ncbi:MAG: hypothetical protein J7647_32485 [Cyanobacteria bacterium SBLK]|nr:hypothetical protein [Cyanobacteria bacterium SBLK]
MCEDISDYVAELQLHMTLQAKNLVPSFPESQTPNNSQQNSPQNLESQELEDSRVQLLRETQASMEKSISRQEILSCRL